MLRVQRVPSLVRLGIVSGGAAIGIAIVGRRGLRVMPDGNERDIKAFTAAQLRRCLPFQVDVIGASVAAIVLLALG